MPLECILKNGKFLSYKKIFIVCKPDSKTRRNKKNSKKVKHQSWYIVENNLTTQPMWFWPRHKWMPTQSFLGVITTERWEKSIYCQRPRQIHRSQKGFWPLNDWATLWWPVLNLLGRHLDVLQDCSIPSWHCHPRNSHRVNTTYTWWALTFWLILR